VCVCVWFEFGLELLALQLSLWAICVGGNAAATSGKRSLDNVLIIFQNPCL